MLESWEWVPVAFSMKIRPWRIAAGTELLSAVTGVPLRGSMAEAPFHYGVALGVSLQEAPASAATPVGRATRMSVARTSVTTPGPPQPQTQNPQRRMSAVPRPTMSVNGDGAPTPAGGGGGKAPLAPLEA